MKTYTLLAIALSTALAGHSQISIDAGDFPAVGDQIVQYTDTVQLSSPGSAGANVTWDFSAAQKQQQTTLRVTDVASTGMQADYPAANLAITEDDGESYGFFSLNGSSYQTQGFATTLPGADPLFYTPALVEYIFPLQYQADFSSSYSSTLSMDGSQMGMYRLIIRHSATVQKNVDGWGTLIIPTGTYQTLRVKVTEESTDSTFMQLTENTAPQFMDASQESLVTYQWLAKNGKLPVATYDDGYLSFTELPADASVNDDTTGPVPLVYPNPATAGQSFRFSGLDNSNYTLYLYDVNGKCLYGQKAPGNALIVDTDGLPAGVYRYTVTDAQQARPHTGSVLIK